MSGPAGRLEALLEEPEGREPAGAALVCHPHPLHGGTMHNKVVYRLARGLRTAGCVTLRFNFRGVNLSEGVYDHGVGEVEDARAVLQELLQRYPGLPLTVAGFSFGSRVASELADVAKRVVLVGYPTVYRTFSALERTQTRRIFVHSTHDEFGPKDDLQALYDRLWGPKELHWIEARDHFFVDALDTFESTVESLL